MLHDLAPDLAIWTHHAPNLLWQSTFPEVILALLALDRDIDVDAAAFTRKHLRGQTRRAEIDLRAIDLVQQDGRQTAEHLDGDVGRFDDVDGRDERVEDQIQSVAVVDRDGVAFASYADRGGFTARDED